MIPEHFNKDKSAVVGLILFMFMLLGNYGGVYSDLSAHESPKEEFLKGFIGTSNHPWLILKWDPSLRQKNYDTLFSKILVILEQKKTGLIPCLISGLLAPEPYIRFHSAYILRFVTSINQGYCAMANESERKQAFQSWWDWWEKKRGHFHFNFQPLHHSTLVVDEIPGRINGNDSTPPGRIVLFNKQGSIAWETQRHLMPYDAVPISHERYLVNIIRARAVWTIGKKGDVLKKMPVGGYPCSLQRLKNGNLLVAGWDDHIPGFVKEFDAGGKVVWEIKNLRWPWKAQRLANHNTLIADAGTNCVFEVNPQGKTVWKVENLGPKKPELFDALGPVYCQRLDDGNTLVSIRGLSRVVELNPTGKVVWQVGKELLLNQYSAVRLWNGNTLIADGGHFRVIEINYKGEIIWEKKGFGYPAKAYRY